MPGLVAASVVLTGELESMMVTVYRDSTTAQQAGEQMRPELVAALGPHVAGPPTRWAGEVVSMSNPPRDPL